MRDLNTLTLICLISFSVIKYTETQNCDHLPTCATTLNVAVQEAGPDTTKLCSAYRTYLVCVTKASADCGVDVSNTTMFVMKAMPKYGCPSSTNGSMMALISWLTLTIGVFFHGLV